MPPRYPVVDPAPTMDTVTANFGFSEYGKWLCVTSLGATLGYVGGKPYRGPSAFTFALTGFIAGYMIAAQSSWGRLTGYLPNDYEVAAYGIKPPGAGPVTALSLAQKSGRLATLWGGRME
ncbi:hypothetical protein VYU27_000256 [Nannochloropsis oceanica]